MIVEPLSSFNCFPPVLCPHPPFLTFNHYDKDNDGKSKIILLDTFVTSTVDEGKPSNGITYTKDNCSRKKKFH